MKLKATILITVCFVLLSCNDYHKNKSHTTTPDISIKAGKQLSMQYCGSCHQVPDPSLLDAKSWDSGVLPQMGPRLGIFFYGFQQYPSSIKDKNIGAVFYPSQPVISFSQWQNIIDYYTATAPDSLSDNHQQDSIQNSTRLFAPFVPAVLYENATTSFIKIQAQRLIVCDVLSEKLLYFNSHLTMLDSFTTNGPVTDLLTDSNKLVLCNTGVLNPNNGRFGKLNIHKVNPDTTEGSKTIFDSLMRPVHLDETDVNGDGKKDIIVCEFGNLKGALSWLENKGNNMYDRHVIRNLPGAVSSYIQDENEDGLPDIWALFSQGDEGIFLFINKGKGVFEQKKIVSFPPSYGSSSFELDDFNKDGFTDIVYTCGDNADYSPVLKPYHGIYIFLNDGKNHFTQDYFFHINGCYKAIAKDFDNDGDLDIATISFFADYMRTPQEGFVYLKNEGDLTFKPYTLPAALNGKWLTMDAGDLDGDGKIDLALGNFCIGTLITKSAIDWKKQPPFLLLKNIQ